ncbi:hypothetical protein D3C86_1873390 [compost metagenome]
MPASSDAEKRNRHVGRHYPADRGLSGRKRDFQRIVTQYLGENLDHEIMILPLRQARDSYRANTTGTGNGNRKTPPMGGIIRI